MTTTTAKKPAPETTRKAAPAKSPAPTAKAPAKTASKPAAPKEQKPEAATLVEALTSKQSALVKVRMNGTVRSLPYLVPGTDARKDAESVAQRVTNGETLPAIAQDLSVSVATARRFITNLALSLEVEAGKHDKAWKPGAKQVVVHTVTAKRSA